MAVLEILKYPEVILKDRALSVDKIDDEIKRLVDNMIETMYAAPGIGLAAPQVGFSKRLIIVDVGRIENEDAPLIVLINPEIVEHEGETEEEEGCLSIPGFTADIKRAEKVLVRGLDPEGKTTEVEGRGLLARALQHEIDHINGTLIIDRLSPLKRRFFKKRIQKAISKTG